MMSIQYGGLYVPQKVPVCMTTS